MMKTMMSKWMARWFVVAAMACSSLAMAQSEPTLNQIYDAAKAGKVEQAQVMIQQVLVLHPNSGKAHFVEAELFARQGNLKGARQALTEAEKLAPGLPFANADAVQKLRVQLRGNSAAETVRPAAAGAATSTGLSAQSVQSAQSTGSSSSSSFPTGLGLALGGGAIAAVIFFMRRRTPAATPAAPGWAAQPERAPGSGLNGPQTFGQPGVGGGNGYGQPGYAGQQNYPQAPAAGGMGGRVMGGLATGLAVGAGVMAAQAIGKNLMGRDEQQPHAAAAAGNDFAPFGTDPEMGGNNFGVADGGSWDDGQGSGAVDGGGDWDGA
jgi:hypothetical protein